MNTYLLMITFRVWFFEIALSGFNYFVLMNRVYEPRVGELRAHRIGMTTRIVYIFFPFAYALVRFADIETVPDMLLAGTFWLLLVLAFEWGEASSSVDRSTRSWRVGTSRGATCGRTCSRRTSSRR
jgi:hypothetical protein